MRLSFALVLLLPAAAAAQTEEMIQALERKLANDRTAKWAFALAAADGGFYPSPPDPKAKPSLRATNGAVRALKYLGHPLLPGEREMHAAFVLSCHDPKTGAFAEPGGKPDVTVTSVGVMAAAELGVPHEKFAKAMDYLKENAKTFEEVRIAAAAVEAWGVKECPFKLDEWVKIATAERETWGRASRQNPMSRPLGSYYAFRLRLGQSSGVDAMNDPWLGDTQRPDGGWGREGEKGSDVESTYRVMRALVLLKEKPKDPKKLRAFLVSHRNADGGYATKPGDPSSMSGVYYCVIVSKWLDDMEKK